MDLKDFNLWAMVAYLLPGVLIVQARSFGSRGRLSGISKDEVTTYLIVTGLYTLALWFMGISLQSPSSVLGLAPIVLLRYFVVTPIVLGFAFGLLESRGIIQRIFIRFGINVPLPIDTAWADVFSRMPVGTYVIVLLKDGTIYNAMVTEDSRFGSDPANPDFFLGQTYHRDTWQPYKPRRSVYVRGAELKSVEIILRP